MTEKDITDAILLLDKSRLDCTFFVKHQDLKKRFAKIWIAEHSDYKRSLPK
jgi:hypothetical protein